MQITVYTITGTLPAESKTITKILNINMSRLYLKKASSSFYSKCFHSDDRSTTSFNLVDKQTLIKFTVLKVI